MCSFCAVLCAADSFTDMWILPRLRWLLAWIMVGRTGANLWEPLWFSHGHIEGKDWVKDEGNSPRAGRGLFPKMPWFLAGLPLDAAAGAWALPRQGTAAGEDGVDGEADVVSGDGLAVSGA